MFGCSVKVMLKWAVNNGSVRSAYLPLTAADGLTATPTSNSPLVATPHVSSRRTLSVLRRQRLKRKASSVKELIENYADDKSEGLKWNVDQEREKQDASQKERPGNCFHASTPLSQQTCSRLADDKWHTSHWLYLQDNDLKVERSHSTRSPSSNGKRHYSRTLPTFEVEYSPSGGQDVYHQQQGGQAKAVVPGPILALRGVVDIPDSYFKKPRYLDRVELKNNNDSIEWQKLVNDKTIRMEENEHVALETKALQINSNLQTQNKQIVPSIMDGNNSLSSSRIGDVTLERMIDAILESTRKERKPLTKRYQIMSPTYTAADDPASDLQEIWEDNNNFGEDYYRLYQGEMEECGTVQIYNNLNQEEWKRASGGKANYQEGLRKKSLFKEEFVENEPTPLKRRRTDIDSIRKKYIGLSSASRKWQRQPAVRRNRRRLTQLTDSLRNSAQRLLGKELLGEAEGVTQSEGKKGEGNHSPENLSPDSGHNSGSEYENEEELLIDDRRELLSELKTPTPNR